MDAKRKKMLLYGAGAVGIGIVAILVIRNRKDGQESGPGQPYFAQLGPNLSGAGSSFAPAPTGSGGPVVTGGIGIAPILEMRPDPEIPGFPGGRPGPTPGDLGDNESGRVIPPVWDRIFPPLPSIDPASIVPPIVSGGIVSGGQRIFPIGPPGIDPSPYPDLQPVAFGGGAPVGTVGAMSQIIRPDIGAGATVAEIASR